MKLHPIYFAVFPPNNTIGMTKSADQGTVIQPQLKKAVHGVSNTISTAFCRLPFVTFPPRVNPFSASNKTRILDMGGEDVLLTLSRSSDEKIRQQATKALANLNPDESARK